MAGDKTLRWSGGRAALAHLPNCEFAELSCHFNVEWLRVEDQYEFVKLQSDFCCNPKVC